MLNWSDSLINSICTTFELDKTEFVKKIAYEGFVPKLGKYICDMEFVLKYGSMELAQIAAKKYYESLDNDIREKFKANYLSMINGGDAVTLYGKNMIRNRSNFKTIIENHIIIDI